MKKSFLLAVLVMPIIACRDVEQTPNEEVLVRELVGRMSLTSLESLTH